MIIQVWGCMVFDFDLDCSQMNGKEQFLLLGILFFYSDDIVIYHFLSGHA